MTEIDRGHDVPVYSEACALCRHLRDSSERPGKCAAFPGGIPMEIWGGSNRHLGPFAGDRGIQFEPTN